MGDDSATGRANNTIISRGGIWLSFECVDSTHLAEYHFSYLNSQEVAEMKAETLDKIAALLTAAFGLVAALAWNGAIRAIFAEVFSTADNIWAMLV